LGRSKGLHSLMVYDNKLEANEDWGGVRIHHHAI
jgi:hypothetical protein